MNPLTLVIAPLALLALAGCQEGMNKHGRVSKAPAATVVGEAEDCISLGSMRQSNVGDNQTIDFEVGGKTYRNTLPYICPGLGFEEAFTYETSLSKLCSTDVIYVLRSAGGRLDRGAGCGLGQFVPIKYVRKGN